MPRRAEPGPARGRWALVGATAALLTACAAPPERPPSPAQQQAAEAPRRAARALQRGDLALARREYGAALAAAQALQDPALTGAALLNLTAVDARRGDLPAAQAHVDQLLADRSASPALHARAAARKALLMLDGGDADGALHWAAQARGLCATPCTLLPVLDNVQAYVALTRGDAAAALAQARRAADGAAATGQTGEQASALRLAGRAATRLGDTAQAADLLAQALALDRQLGQPDRVALDLLYAAENETRRGNHALAADLTERAATVYAATGDARTAADLRARPAGR